MKNLSEMTVDELSKLEQKHLEELVRVTDLRNKLIAAAATAKKFELEKQNKLRDDVNKFLRTLTNILPPLSMKQIGQIIPEKSNAKLSPEFFSRIFDIVNSEKNAMDKTLEQLVLDVKNVQGESDSRAQFAMKLHLREIEIQNKKPLSLRLRFLVWVRNIFDKIINNKSNLLLVSIEDSITRLLPTIIIPVAEIESAEVEAPVVESPEVESGLDSDLSTTSSVVKSAAPVGAKQLQDLKALKMPKKKVVIDSAEKEESEMSSVEDSQGKGEVPRKPREKAQSLQALHKMGSFRTKPRNNSEDSSEVNAGSKEVSAMKPHSDSIDDLDEEFTKNQFEIKTKK